MKKAEINGIYVWANETNVLFYPDSNVLKIESSNMCLGHLWLYPEEYGDYKGEVLLSIKDDTTNEYVVKIRYQGRYIDPIKSLIEYRVNMMSINSTHRVVSIELLNNGSPVDSLNGLGPLGYECTADMRRAYFRMEAYELITCERPQLASQDSNIVRIYNSVSIGDQPVSHILVIPFTGDLVCSDRVLVPAFFEYKNKRIQECSEPVYLSNRFFQDYTIESCIYNFFPTRYNINFTMERKMANMTSMCYDMKITNIQTQTEMSGHILYQGYKVCHICKISLREEKQGSVVVSKGLGPRKFSSKYIVSKSDSELLHGKRSLSSGFEDEQEVTIISSYPFNILIDSITMSNPCYTFNLVSAVINAQNSTIIGTAKFNYFNTEYYHNLSSIMHKHAFTSSDVRGFKEIEAEYKSVTTSMKILTDIGSEITVQLKTTIPPLNLFTNTKVAVQRSAEYSMVPFTLYNPTNATIFGMTYLQCNEHNEILSFSDLCEYSTPSSITRIALNRSSSFFVLGPNATMKFSGIFIQGTMVGSYLLHLVVKNNLTYFSTTKFTVSIEKPSYSIIGIKALENTTG
jgi:hypothetical protein